MLELFQIIFERERSISEKSHKYKFQKCKVQGGFERFSQQSSKKKEEKECLVSFV